MMKKKGEVFMVDHGSKSLGPGKLWEDKTWTTHWPWAITEGLLNRWVGGASSWSQAVTNPSGPDEGTFRKPAREPPGHTGEPQPARV